MAKAYYGRDRCGVRGWETKYHFTLSLQCCLVGVVVLIWEIGFGSSLRLGALYQNLGFGLGFYKIV